MTNKKIIELKEAIRKAEKEQEQLASVIHVGEEPKKKQSKDLRELYVVIEGLKEELKLTIMNKIGSRNFEWIPTPGMNRNQRRQYNKLKKTK